MRTHWTWLVCLPLTLSACDNPNRAATPAAGGGTTAGPTLTVPTAAAAPTTRPRDPWVFRSVLDQQARMLTVALSDKLWLAYDAQTCSLRKAWDGGVKFTGGVYDTRHGPQPESQGTVYFEAQPPTWLRESTDGPAQPVTPRYVGYTMQGDGVVLRYQIDLGDAGQVDVEERPEVAADTDGNAPVSLQRAFQVKGLRAPQRLTLVLPGANARLAGVEGTEPVLAPSPANSPAARGMLTFTGDATVTVVVDLKGLEK